MRFWHYIVAALLWVGLSACGQRSMPSIVGLAVAEVEMSDALGSQPERVIVKVDVDNPSPTIKVKSARARISYRGRNVAVLRLEETVKVPARSRSEVVAGVKVSVAHNSHAVAFNEALRRAELGEVAIDFTADVRVAGVKRYRVEQPFRSLSEVVPEPMMGELIEALTGAEGLKEAASK